MNNIIIIEIAGLLFLVSTTVSIFSGLALFFDDLENRNPKNDKIIFIISLIVLVLSFTVMIIYSIKNPQPTFREVCEANNGIYVENHGRAGNSCIYNR